MTHSSGNQSNPPSMKKYSSSDRHKILQTSNKEFVVTIFEPERSRIFDLIHKLSAEYPLEIQLPHHDAYDLDNSNYADSIPNLVLIQEVKKGALENRDFIKKLLSELSPQGNSTYVVVVDNGIKLPAKPHNTAVTEDFDSNGNELNENKTGLFYVKYDQLEEDLKNKLGSWIELFRDSLGQYISGEKNGSVQVIDDSFCYYNEYALPNAAIVDTNRYVPNRLREKFVFSLDVDGTLLRGDRGFVLARFLDFLKDNHLIPDISSKERALNLLNESRLQLEDPQSYKYENALDNLAEGYAQLLKGLKVVDVCKMGNIFSRLDFNNNAFHFSYQLVRGLKACGIVPTLITGIPAETIGGYREQLGIQEIGHPMTMEIKGEGSEMVYTGYVGVNRGLGQHKGELAEQIIQNDNLYLGHIGDRMSDAAPASYAIREDGIDDNKVFGRGYFLVPDTGKHGDKMRHDLNEKDSKHLSRGLYQIYSPDRKDWQLLRMIFNGIIEVSRMARDIGHANQGKWSALYKASDELFGVQMMTDAFIDGISYEEYLQNLRDKL